MGNLSEHFDSSEFACECCGKTITMSQLLISRLEQIHDMLDAKAIYINSGYRCENNPWGSPTDAHRKGMAADIRVQKQDGSFYTSENIAEAAERIGFGGIGMMMPDSCHVDTRDSEPYTNNHWYGNETTGENFIDTFQRGTVFTSRNKNAAKSTKSVSVTLTIDGETYSGTLTEK
jgi:hypothetical protein